MASCFALVRFQNDASISGLSQYLDKFFACENNFKKDYLKG